MLFSNIFIFDSEMQTIVYATDLDDENVIEKKLDESTYHSLCNELSACNLSIYEKNVEILKSLDISDNIIQSMSEDEINEMLVNAESIETKMTYYSMDENGQPTIISEDECMEMIACYENNTLISTAENGDSNGYLVGGGCMRITITTVFLNPSSENNQKGWFFIHVWYEWLVLDSNRNLDVIFITVPNVSWDDDMTNSFSSSCFYHVTDSDGNVGNYSGGRVTGTQMKFGGPSGFGHCWNLPKDSGNSRVTYIQYYLKAKARLQEYDHANTYNVFAYYEHLRYSLTPVLTSDVVWTVNSKGEMSSEYVLTYTEEVTTVSDRWFILLADIYNPATLGGS